MNELKWRLMKIPILVTLDFSLSVLMIILLVDASIKIEWGEILLQLQSDRRVRSAWFESEIWSPAKLKHNAVKLVCRRLLKALKKFRFWLYERYFTVETDAQTIIWLLNQSLNDLPKAMMIRWLAYIQLFDFDVKHISDTKNDSIDILSRCDQDS